MRPFFRWTIRIVCLVAILTTRQTSTFSPSLSAADDKKEEKLNLDLVGRNLKALFGGPQNVPAVETPQITDEAVQEQIKAMAMQFEQQYRPIMITELEFIRLTFHDLPLEQRKAIRIDAETSLKKLAKGTAAQQNGQQGIVFNRNIANSNPRDLLRNEIKERSKTALTKEQFAHYEHALQERFETKRQAAIDGAVALTDHHLYLTAKQRDDIKASLVAGWKDGWEKWLLISVTFGDQYFPTLPENLVTPFLSEEQKAVWRSMNRQDFEFWQGGQAIDFNDDEWWGPDPKIDDDQGAPNGRLQVLELFR